MTEAVTLVANRLCPFAHRAWLSLLEKNVNFTYRDVDLIKKEPWFTQTYRKAYGHDPSSDGKVPILIHGQRIITESDLVAWYVAETFQTGSQLIPSDPFQKLKVRRFIQNVPGKLISAFYSITKFNLKSEAEQKQVIEKIFQNLRAIENEIQGPFAIGETYSLADIILYPWFERWCILERLFGIKIPEDLVKIHAFIKAVQSRPAVQKAKSEVSEDSFVKAYESYLKG